jgi:dTDP-4-amino-4,6-dideoxygalactose transaminase
MDALVELAERERLLLIEDCAQAHGARFKGQRVGSFGTLAAFSFYPTKNLGACGDGGAVLTRDRALADRLRRLRNYGQTTRYHHQERGINSRLDELQAALLRVKLERLDACNARRRELARYYRLSFDGVVHPVELPAAEHVYHLYVVRHPERDALRATLRELGMETQVHYPVPVHLQTAYADLGRGPGSLPVTEHTAASIVSLPMYIGLGHADVVRIGASFSARKREAA